MRALGLVGSGGRYSIRSETHWARVGFQKSAYSDRQEIRFTVSLLVVSRARWDRLRGEKPHFGAEPSATITYGPPVLTARIGLLSADQEDKWWRVGLDHDMDSVAREVMSDVQFVGLPWLREGIGLPDS
ncbi:hypothetical protein BH11ACT5_BH11ACT5_24700 [soil metagenome]